MSETHTHTHTHNTASQLFLCLAYIFNKNRKPPYKCMVKFRINPIINSGEVLHMIMNGSLLWLK